MYAFVVIYEPEVLESESVVMKEISVVSVKHEAGGVKMVVNGPRFATMKALL